MPILLVDSSVATNPSELTRHVPKYLVDGEKGKCLPNQASFPNIRQLATIKENSSISETLVRARPWMVSPARDFKVRRLKSSSTLTLDQRQMSIVWVLSYETPVTYDSRAC